MTFEEFVAARLPALSRYAVVLTGDPHLAQDVLQEVLARALVRWRRIEATGAAEPYVRRMLVNELLSWRRSWAFRHVQPTGARLAELADRRLTGGDHASALAEADEVWARLATLPRRQRAVLVLRYYEGLGDAEIADILGCSPATVRSHVSKALHTLRLTAPSHGPPTPVRPRRTGLRPTPDDLEMP